MSNVTRDWVSGYRRQLSVYDLKRAATFLGKNDNEGEFNSSKVYFAAEYEDINPPETSALVWNGRGTATEYALPKVPPETVAFKVLDWDADLRMQLEAWQFDRQVVRWWAPGSHFVVGTISRVQVSRPAKDKIEVVLRCRGIFFYDTNTPQQFNTAYPNNLVAHGRFYGAQV